MCAQVLVLSTHLTNPFVLILPLCHTMRQQLPCLLGFWFIFAPSPTIWFCISLMACCLPHLQSMNPVNIIQGQQQESLISWIEVPPHPLAQKGI
jgi:hypothetical protein